MDNASHDGSAQMVREEFPNIMLIESLENLGFGRANNLGAKHAKGTYLLLLNPDTILLNNAVKILFDFIDSHPKVGICGGNLFDAAKKPALSYQMFLPSVAGELDDFLRISTIIYGKNSYFNHTKKPLIVKGYITGADLMIKTSLFNQLNGFDTDFFVYYEETELTFRVKKAGYAVYSVPQAEIIHLEGQTFSGDRERKTRMFLESRKKYYQKTHCRFVSWICDRIFLCSCVLYYCLFVVAGKSQKANNWMLIIKYL